MSIKSQLTSLRKRQEEFDKLIKDFSTQLADEESQEKSISNDVEQFAKRTSELAVKLHQEYKQKLKVQSQKVDELKSILEQYRKEYSSNEEKIKSYLEDTSFYINEQVPHLIEKFLKYVEKNQIELGTSITSKFVFNAITDDLSTRESEAYIPNGNFCIKKITGSKRFDVIVAETKDYYFERKIGDIDERYWGNARLYLEDWYTTYANAFTKAFMDSLAEKFMSKSFKLTINGDSFTLDLI